MADTERRGRLSFKLLFWFMSISLIPVGVMGWHLANTSLNVFKKVSLRNQQSSASRFAETVTHTLQSYKDVLVETVRLGEFAQTAPANKEQYLLRLMQMHPAFIELSVIDLAGKETIQIGRYRQDSPEPRDFFADPAFQTALQHQQYIGSLERIKGIYPALTISVPIMVEVPDGSTGTVSGVLMGKISLTPLSNLLADEIGTKDLRQGAVAAPGGFVVAHSDPGQVFRPNASLPKGVSDMLARRVSPTGGEEIELPDGSTVLGAFASIEDIGWIVYVQQPLRTAYHAALKIRKQIGKILLWVIAITVLLSLAVAAHITLPIRELTYAADQLTVGQFEDLSELTLTNDEIGDLGQSFFQMSESLRDKTDELLEAKAQLEKFQGTLQKRVEARERELHAAQDELVTKERLAAMGSMASVVGHEIRNPLAVINNSIFFIKAKLGKANRLDDKLDRHVKLIESEIRQANGIINEILAYSRSRDLNCKAISLTKFINAALSVYPFPPHIRIIRDFDKRDPFVDIDADEMRQALRNLIGNAVEVMPTQGALSVRTKMTEDGWARVELRDTGPGIPPDVLNKMFAPFYTTKARGTGLGLAVVRKVLDRHEGRVDAISEVGKGTMFRLFLPLHKGPLPAARPTR